MPLTSVQKFVQEVKHYQSLYFENSIRFEDIPEEIQKSIRLSTQEDRKWSRHLCTKLKNKEILLKDLPSKFWFFSSIDLSNCDLNSLEGMPKSLDHVFKLKLQNNLLQSLDELPSKLPNIVTLTLDNNPLLSLKGLPSSLPELIWFRADDLPQLSTLEGFSLSVPKLRDISFRNNRLLSLKGLPSHLPSLEKISFGSSFDPAKRTNLPLYPLRTLSYVSKPILREMLHFIDSRTDLPNLTSKGQELFAAVRRTFYHDGMMETAEYDRITHHMNEYFSDPCNLAKPKDEPDPDADAINVRYARNPAEKQRSLAAIDTAFEALWQYYTPTPEELAVRYCEEPSTLTKEEYQRLVHEADHADWKLLSQNLSNSNQILADITKSHPLRLNADFSLL